MEHIPGYDGWKLDTPSHYDFDESRPYCTDCGEPLNDTEWLQSRKECRNCEVYNSLFVYKNKAKASGVVAYRSGNNYISILFHDGSYYRYTKTSAGYDVLRKMQYLARKGIGLNSFISRNRPPYTMKEKTW